MMGTAIAIIGALVMFLALFRFFWGLWRLEKNTNPDDRSGGNMDQMWP
jgi:hypothetical protein